MSKTPKASFQQAPDHWKTINYSWEEITPIENQSVLEYHSVINVLNVIHALVDLCDIEGKLPVTGEILQMIRDIVAGFHDDPGKQTLALENCKPLQQRVVTFTESQDPHDEEHIDSLQTIIEANQVLQQRIVEILDRRKTNGKWIKLAPDEIREELKNFFNVVERNSAGSYKIVYNVSDQEPKDYVVCIDLQLNGKNSFFVPPTLIDIIRDLAANARKYTDPGGSIVIRLEQDRQEIMLFVGDNGRGIPEGELSKVSNYGYRASNVKQRKTMGGGFGLTKALYFAKEQKGDLKIHSYQGEGTRIALSFPFFH